MVSERQSWYGTSSCVLRIFRIVFILLPTHNSSCSTLFIFTKHDPFVFRTSTDVTIFVGFVSKWFQSGVPYVARFSRLSIFIIATSVFSNVYLSGFHGFSRTWFVPMSFDLGSYLFFFQRILFWYQKLVNIFWNMYQ